MFRLVGNQNPRTLHTWKQKHILLRKGKEKARLQRTARGGGKTWGEQGSRKQLQNVSVDIVDMLVWDLKKFIYFDLR